MTNTERIQAHNELLRECIETAENLPDAGTGGREPIVEPLEVIENGTYAPPEGVDGYSPVSVNVPIPDEYIVPTGTKTITENGTHDVTEYALVYVNVSTGGEGGTDTRFKDFIEDTLTEVDDSTITTTKTRAFDSALSLVRVSLTNATSLGSYTFNGCENLVSVNLPNVTSAIPTYCFTGCTALSQINVPNATGANNYSFQDCSSLEKVELGHATSVGSYSFRRSGVTALIIRNTTTKLTNLTATNAFTDCPIANGTGYIYFYREYVESYKAKTGWANYAEQIRAIEDYPEITGG